MMYISTDLVDGCIQNQNFFLIIFSNFQIYFNNGKNFIANE